jgi:hypothetical protein
MEEKLDKEASRNHQAWLARLGLMLEKDPALRSLINEMESGNQPPFRDKNGQIIPKKFIFTRNYDLYVKWRYYVFVEDGESLRKHIYRGSDDSFRQQFGIPMDWKCILLTPQIFSEIQNALRLEREGYLEGAINTYMAYGLYNQVLRLRDLQNDKMRTTTVKHVTVDINRLVEQIAARGLVIQYKCQNCGATINIDKDSDVAGLKHCSYCGTAYDVLDMSEILEQALK